MRSPSDLAYSLRNGVHREPDSPGPALFFASRRPWPLRVWARHLGSVRERTVLETHLSRWLAAFAVFPPGRAAGVALRAIGGDLRPVAHEDWSMKLGRARSDQECSWPLCVWARNLGSVRERTVLETHLVRWFAGFSAFPPSRAARMAVRAVGSDLRPLTDEDWPMKLERTRRAIQNAFVRRSRHGGRERVC